MSDIFLSYASQDKSRVPSLIRALERHGWSVWWDRRILPGKSYDQVIEEALQRARCVVVVWSKASVQSEWVRTEAEAARQRQILVPVLIDSGVHIPLAFMRIQAASLWDWEDTRPHPEFERFILAVTDLIGPPEHKQVEAPLRRRPEEQPPPRRRPEEQPPPRQ
jgi:TIR domain